MSASAVRAQARFGKDAGETFLSGWLNESMPLQQKIMADEFSE